MRNFFFARYQNHKKHLANMIAAATLAAGLAAGSAQATDITADVPNADFTHFTPAHTGSNYGQYVPGNGDSWTGSAYNSAIKNTDYVPNRSVYTVAAYATAGFPLSQTLGTTWAAGTYTLSVQALTDASATLTPELRDGGVGGTLAGTPTTTTVAAGLDSNGTLASSTFVIPFGSSFIGDPITIEFEGTGRPFFDQLSLNFTAAVPEPGAATLLGTGTVGMALAALRRRWRSRHS